MCIAKPTARGGRNVTPSGIVYYDDTPEGNVAQSADMAATGVTGENSQPAAQDTDPVPTPPDEGCEAYTDAMWDKSCSTSYKFANMKMKPSAQNGLTAVAIACNWQRLCKNILDHIGKVTINSAFRTLAFNSSLGNASKTSDHMIGAAVDLSAGSVEANKELFKKIGSMMINGVNLPFNQLIFEGKWVHVAMGGRGSGILYTRTGTAPYSNGGANGIKLPSDLRWIA